MKTTGKGYRQEFIELALECNVLQFGEFELKSGRISPYFFNAGKFSTGAALARLGRCYAAALRESGLPTDMLFGLLIRAFLWWPPRPWRCQMNTALICPLPLIAKKPKPTAREAVLWVRRSPAMSWWSMT